MKGYTNSTTMYVFPQTVGEIPSVGAGVTEILVQQEDLAAWKTANSDYASIMKAYNYNTMTVQKKVWADHINDNITVSPELAWSAESASAQIGETNTYPTLTNSHSVTVAYSSSDTEKATIDESTGEITLVAAGTTTISAVFAGNDTYTAQTVTYTLTVNAAQNNDQPE